MHFTSFKVLESIFSPLFYKTKNNINWIQESHIRIFIIFFLRFIRIR